MIDRPHVESSHFVARLVADPTRLGPTTQEKVCRDQDGQQVQPAGPNESVGLLVLKFVEDPATNICTNQISVSFQVLKWHGWLHIA